MRRRAVLAAVGTSLAGTAGCSASLGGGTTTTDRTTTRSLPTFDATTVQRQVSLADVDDVPDHPVAIDAELLNGAVTGEDPARVRVTVTNEADEKRYFTNNDGECALFNRGGGASDPAGAHLHQPDFPGYAGPCADPTRRGNLWQLDLSSSTQCLVQDYGCAPVAYDAGETKSTTYQVWDDYTVKGYLPPDTYRFEERVILGENEGDEEFRWGFSLIVELPD